MKKELDYCVGNDLIDNQHKILFDIFMKLEKLIAEKALLPELVKWFDFLKAFYVYHAEHEEQLQKELEFPEFERHKALHTSFTLSLNEANMQIKIDQGANPEKIHKPLVEWFEKHVVEEDKKICQYLDLHCNYGRERLFFLEKEEKNTIEQIGQLRILFTKKLITIEDFKEQKVKLINRFFSNIGLNQIVIIVNLLSLFQEKNLISEPEAKACLETLLLKTERSKALAEIGEVEGQLHYIKALLRVGLVDEDEYDKLKLGVFNSFAKTVSK